MAKAGFLSTLDILEQYFIELWSKLIRTYKEETIWKEQRSKH